MFRVIKDVVVKRELIMTLAKADFKKRFVGSFLGVCWMFVQPIVTILIYYLVFQLGFKSQPVADVPYVLWLVPAIVPWFFFCDAWSGGTGCLYEYQHLVKKMVFRVSILPIIKILASFFVHLIFICIMLVFFLICGMRPSLWWLQMFYYSFCVVFLVLGLSYISASVNAFFKDAGQLVQVFLQMGMWLAPIMWAETLVPEKYRFIIKFNPFYYIVEGFRDCFISHEGFWERPVLSAYFWLVSIIIFVIGVVLFKKLRPHFADVL